jgi:hypothetical protein
MEATCTKCGVTAVITDVRSGGRSFVMKPGESLDQLCPVIIDRKEKNRTAADDTECPHLNKAIEERIEQFRRQHP